LRSRRLALAALAALAAAVPAARADVALAFLSPAPLKPLVGEATFSFRVGAHDPPVERVDVYVGGALAGAARAPDWTLTVPVPPEASGTPVLAAAFAGGRLVGQAKLYTANFVVSDNVEVLRVQLYPVVTDRSGHAVEGLKRSDFTVLEDGRPVRIEDFESKPSTLRLALLMDVIGSMGDRISLVQEAAQGLLDSLRAADEVALYAFNDSTRRLVAPTRDRAAVVAGLETLQAAGATGLYDAVVRVVDDLGRLGGRKAVLVFSDGRDRGSTTTLERAVEAARRSDVLIYSIGAVSPNDEGKGREDLLALARTSGGKALFFDETQDLADGFSAVVEDLRAQYFLSFAPPAGPPGVRRLQVKVRNGDYVVRARTAYVHGGGR
jgi:Ca-activated chloride channel family protein